MGNLSHEPYGVDEKVAHSWQFTVVQQQVLPCGVRLSKIHEDQVAHIVNQQHKSAVHAGSVILISVSGCGPYIIWRRYRPSTNTVTVTQPALQCTQTLLVVSFCRRRFTKGAIPVASKHRFIADTTE